MSSRLMWVAGAVVLVVLVAVAAYAGFLRDTGVTVVAVGIVIIGAIALSVVVSRRQGD
ncbi:hypothetical protein [Actinomycetospora chiangmaiensis]|uniref:hypothetical protein n=1 Tax=Actinomycetospora chiangmaiensis TaxID=402650 RepID=UPI0012F7A094|nr:hypothetical protein [Actinomycetospora chiangmaiensis]